MNLPIYDVIGDIRSALLTSNRLILQAPPGAGKTTSVPLALLDEPWLEGKQIIMLEPRRIAARSAAERMAHLLGEKVGMRIGYQIRAEKKLSSDTKILVVTEGILTRMLQSDPSLESVALIIFDEFHERHLHSDLSLAFALQSQEFLREDLKIMVMSATLDTDALQRLLNHPPLITSVGRSFPIAIEHLPPNTPTIEPKKIVAALMDLIQTIIHSDEGSILVFLPGSREIKALEGMLKAYYKEREIDISPLYGELSKEVQERAIAPSLRRKIVLATNIAETSLTIEGITIVVDSGLEKVLTFDPRSGMERLVTQRISRASADQRAGRAGRLSAGKCYRLWSATSHQMLTSHKEPEIRLCDLTPLALELGLWGDNELSWITPPPAKALAHGVSLLQMMGAMDAKGSITAHGKAMMGLGIHPRLAHMIRIGQTLGYESEAIVLAALLNERDLFARSSERTSDMRERFWRLCDAFNANVLPPVMAENANFILATARDIAKRLTSSLRLSADFPSEMIALLLTLAYPDRIARLRSPKGDKYLLSNGKEVRLAQEDDLIGEEWLIVTQSGGESTTGQIYQCAPLCIDVLERYLPELFSTEATITWNAESERVEAREITRLGAIIVESRPLEHPDAMEVKRTLLEGIRSKGVDALPWSASSVALRHRLQTMHYHCSENSFGNFSDEALLSSLEIWLLPHLSTQSSLRECESLDLYAILTSQLSWEETQRLNALLPTHFSAPSGTSVALDYSNPEAVILAVRIQEVFGLGSHPSVFEGKIPLLIHLLSPARRPIQVTRDLIGFWNGSYNDVKKELKGRYPKHYWPDDPRNAEATSRTKKYM
ncbi:MAG TPA: ATP-dependent helicase HrpB [Sulfuricurvum kujiense]|uniref:ATP-dependent helicase HrpB n=1 Tax=Sulfuricurvum kujiense TaxID=148813 RepID=A0A2D3WLD3_9BACT|nr:ATP-dependent helicase HrpB [Sulfuricurvum kujiense]DAB37363.1 MAG TPA: ATP-dependent helicase HrpB [Sulfuricurvum kujiense]